MIRMSEETKTANEELNFEQAMEQLEEIVRALEEGDVPLEKAIELYKRYGTFKNLQSKINFCRKRNDANHER